MKCEAKETIFIASLVIFLLGQATAQFLEPECGALRFSKRVVNGRDAEKGLYPWMAYIHRGEHLACGGTLINHWFVLTAAHCITKPKGLTVSLGVYDSRELDPSRLYQVERFFKHWSYVRFSKGSDIGLLKLARKVEFSGRFLVHIKRLLTDVTISFPAHVRPICILTESNIKVERLDWFLAIGWGNTEPDGNTSPVLQTKMIERRDRSECDCLDSQICTVAESGTICYGDSGGPVVRELKIQQKSRYVQLGVTSYVTDHCRAHGIFTDVLSHTMWIQFVVGRHTPNDG
ncbi:hypothetical protein KR054_008028 [Drosophila jambulina]|nr:hypothetical protein KR054_008028 [Drosophila jambulina]